MGVGTGPAKASPNPESLQCSFRTGRQLTQDSDELQLLALTASPPLRPHFSKPFVIPSLFVVPWYYSSPVGTPTPPPLPSPLRGHRGLTSPTTEAEKGSLDVRRILTGLYKSHNYLHAPVIQHTSLFLSNLLAF